MEKCVMRMWVRLVLKPYVEMAPGNIQPVLLLDSYRCHMMTSIVNDIQDLGVEFLHIPGGCTGLCEPRRHWHCQSPKDLSTSALGGIDY
jgi:hypothetical protein